MGLPNKPAGLRIDLLYRDMWSKDLDNAGVGPRGEQFAVDLIRRVANIVNTQPGLT